MKELNRRDFVKIAPPGMAALLGSIEFGFPDSAVALEPQVHYDVAIVGGGVAGCYVAYRLSQATEADFKPHSPLLPILRENGKLKIGLFEYSGRVGGRLLSAEIPRIKPDGSRYYAEFGGFRFQTQMHIVRDLACHLGLECEPFPVDEPPENFVYLRGKQFRRGDLPKKAAKNLPYNFRPSELELLERDGDFGTCVANQAFAEALSEFNGPNPTYDVPNGYINLRTLYHKAFQDGQKTNNRLAWERVEERRNIYETAKQTGNVDGRSLIDWSWWSLMSRFVSSEAIAYYEDSGGYKQLLSPGSMSSNLREDFYFATAGDIYGSSNPSKPCEQTAWKHVVTGYSDIPNKMYQAFLYKQGNDAGALNHQLVSFGKFGSDRYVLRFFKRESGTLNSGIGTERIQADPSSQAAVTASHLVLAMPKRSLEQLDRNNFFFRTPSVNQLLGTVLNNPALRLFMAYERPWWNDPPVKEPRPHCGRSTTDLNVRQFYYWHTAEEGGPSFMLATYSNAEAQDYWKGLQKGAAHDRHRGTTKVEGRFDGAQGRGPRAATAEMAKLAHQQLVEVVYGKPFSEAKKEKGFDVPEPYYAHFQDWVKDPWGAGWHAFTAENNDVTLIPKIIHPIEDENLYIVGECYSNVQGWVQGALNTSEVMLENHLGLEFPSEWLSIGGTWLGPGSTAPTVPPQGHKEPAVCCVDPIAPEQAG